MRIRKLVIVGDHDIFTFNISSAVGVTATVSITTLDGEGMIDTASVIAGDYTITEIVPGYITASSGITTRTRSNRSGI